MTGRARAVGRLLIDPIACDGRGLCAELLPEHIRMDEWGFPLVVEADLPEAHLELARRAVDMCPLLALRIVAPLPSEGVGRVRPRR